MNPDDPEDLLDDNSRRRRRAFDDLDDLVHAVDEQRQAEKRAAWHAVAILLLVLVIALALALWDEGLLP